jgi:hypothetical protein
MKDWNERQPQFLPGAGESLMPGQEGVTGVPYQEPAPMWDPKDFSDHVFAVASRCD